MCGRRAFSITLGRSDLVAQGAEGKRAQTLAAPCWCVAHGYLQCSAIGCVGMTLLTWTDEMKEQNS
jgi:hypothetical protein